MECEEEEKESSSSALVPKPKRHCSSPPPPEEKEEAVLSKTIHGAEHFLVGLSPTYWCHVPLSVHQLHHLQLINGINCLREEQANYNEDNSINISSNNKNIATTGNHHLGQKMHQRQVKTEARLIPVSRCQLVGCIVAVERRRGNNGSGSSVTYVLDDGTGLVDCLHYATDSEAYALPSLSSLSSSVLDTLLDEMACQGEPERSHTNRDDDGILSVGTVVRVFGRISCLAILDSSDSNNNNGNSALSGLAQKNGIIREVHASSVEPIATSLSSSSARANPFSLDAETRHWQRLSHQSQKDPVQSQSPPPLFQQQQVFNAIDVLKRLGPDIQSQALVQKASNPCGGDENDEKRSAFQQLFGISCNCYNDKNDSSIISSARVSATTITKRMIVEKLLYCHCQATPVRLDPTFAYRDALLLTLLEQEQRQQQSFSSCENEGIISNRDGDINNNNTHEDDKLQKSRPLPSSPFRFQYQTIVKDCHLQQIACQVVAGSKVVSAISSRPAAGDDVGPRDSDGGITTHPPCKENEEEEKEKEQRVLLAQQARVCRLGTDTFRALRQDGIIHLVCGASDTYLLVSRAAILDPYVRQIVRRETNNSSSNGNHVPRRKQRIYWKRHQTPPHLVNVPISRLDYVQKTLLLSSLRSNDISK